MPLLWSNLHQRVGERVFTILKKLTRRVADAPAQYAREGQKAWKHVVILVFSTMLVVMLGAQQYLSYSNMEEQVRCRQIKETILHEQ